MAERGKRKGKYEKRKKKTIVRIQNSSPHIVILSDGPGWCRVIAKYYHAGNEFISKHLQRRISQMPIWIPVGVYPRENGGGDDEGGLVWYEHYDDISEAIVRGNQIKAGPGKRVNYSIAAP